MARTHAVLCVGVFVLGVQLAAAAPQTGRGGQRPAAQRPAPAPLEPAGGSAIGIRVVGTGLGANGSELRPFNESPGTTVVLAVQASGGSGIVEIDSRAGKVESFTDDKGQSLLEEGRIGPKVAEDGTAAMIEVEVRARPSAGAAAVTVQGTLALTLALQRQPVGVFRRRRPTGSTHRDVGRRARSRLRSSGRREAPPDAAFRPPSSQAFT